MPAMDGTGPTGNGPTGRGLGPCGGGQTGRRPGRGFHRGWRGEWGMPQTLPPEEEKALLERHKGWLERELEAVNKRMQGN